MPDTTIRRLEGDEKLEAMYSLTSYALNASPPLRDKEEWKGIVRPRQGVTTMILFEDETPASCASGTAMVQNVRGKLFDASGVWGVATAPAARRRGYCRRTIAAVLAAGHDDGQAFSNLYPSASRSTGGWVRHLPADPHRAIRAGRGGAAVGPRPGRTDRWIVSRAALSLVLGSDLPTVY